MEKFIYALMDFLEGVNLDYPINIGKFDENPSIMVRPIEGKETVRKFMNGTEDMLLPFEMSIKSKMKDSQEILQIVLRHLINMNDFLQSKNNIISILGYEINQIPLFQEKDEDYFYYNTKFTFELTVENEKIK